MEIISPAKKKTFRKTMQSSAVASVGLNHKSNPTTHIAGLSLDRIAALSREGLERLAGSGGAAALPPPVEEERHVDVVQLNEAEDPSQAQPRRASRRRDGEDIQATREHVAAPPPLTFSDPTETERERQRAQQYIATLEEEVAVAEKREKSVCAMLFTTAMRAAVSELQHSESEHRHILEAECFLHTQELVHRFLRHCNVELSVLGHRIRSMADDKKDATAHVNPMVTMTAQAYVLNDLRHVMESHHVSQHQTQKEMEHHIRTLVETHAATLHLAAAKTQESVQQATAPIASQLSHLSQVLASVRMDNGESQQRINDAVETSSTKLSATMIEFKGILKLLDERTKELINATATTRQALFEDLNKRLAVDEKRWANIVSSIKDSLTAVEGNITRCVKDAMSDSATHWGASLTSTLPQNIQQALSGYSLLTLAQQKERDDALEQRRNETIQSEVAVLKAQLASQKSELLTALRETMSLKVSSAAEELTTMETRLQPLLRGIVRDEVQGVVKAQVQLTSTTVAAIVPAAAIAKTNTSSQTVDVQMAPVVDALPSSSLASQFNEMMHIMKSWLEQRLSLCSQYGSEMAMAAMHHHLQQQQPPQQVVPWNVVTKKYSDAEGSPFIPQGALGGFSRVPLRSMRDLRRLSGVEGQEPSTVGGPKVMPPVVVEVAAVTQDTQQQHEKTTVESSSMTGFSPQPKEEDQRREGSIIHTKRRVSREMIIPFSTIPVDVATTSPTTTNEDANNSNSNQLLARQASQLVPSPALSASPTAAAPVVEFPQPSPAAERSGPLSKDMAHSTSGAAAAVAVGTPQLARVKDFSPQSPSPLQRTRSDMREAVEAARNSVDDISLDSLLDDDEGEHEDARGEPLVMGSATVASAAGRGGTLANASHANSFDDDEEEDSEDALATPGTHHQDAVGRDIPSSPQRLQREEETSRARTPSKVSTSKPREVLVTPHAAAVDSRHPPASSNDDTLLDLKPGGTGGKKKLPMW